MQHQLFEPTKKYEESDAVLSDCGKYRYLLRRTWDHNLPRVLFVMLNPSTADAEQDDATIRSCVRLSKTFGYGGFEVVNLFAWRATDPDDLIPLSMEDAVGPRTTDVMEAAINRCDLVICAWGKNKKARDRARSVWSTIKAHRPAAFCLGRNKDGSPMHPLYIKSGTPLTVYMP